jgi:hypothetical protein
MSDTDTTTRETEEEEEERSLIKAEAGGAADNTIRESEADIGLWVLNSEWAAVLQTPRYTLA